METSKYISDMGIRNDFLENVKNSLGKSYSVITNKRIGSRDLDLFIENPQSKDTFAIEFKGSPQTGSLPPEIIPWLESLNKKINAENQYSNNHLIIVSLAKVNDGVMELFENNGIKVFDYSKYSDNPTGAFVSLIHELEDKTEFSEKLG